MTLAKGDAKLTINLSMIDIANHTLDGAAYEQVFFNAFPADSLKHGGNR